MFMLQTPSSVEIYVKQRHQDLLNDAKLAAQVRQRTKAGGTGIGFTQRLTNLFFRPETSTKQHAKVGS